MHSLRVTLLLALTFCPLIASFELSSAPQSSSADQLSCYVSQSSRLQSAFRSCRELQLLLNRTHLLIVRTYSLSSSLVDSVLPLPLSNQLLPVEQLLHLHLHLLRQFALHLHSLLPTFASIASVEGDLLTHLYHAIKLQSISAIQRLCLEYRSAQFVQQLPQVWSSLLKQPSSVVGSASASRAVMARLMFLTRYSVAVDMLHQQYSVALRSLGVDST
jgi:hypothetical protein